jgi:O-Antigen ligase
MNDSAVPLATNWNDRYLLLLSGVLFGYALLGKGFAYIGLPPLFIGEITLLAGIAVLLGTKCFVASLTALPSLLLALTMGWVLARTIPFVGTYGIDALRDSVVIFYGIFAFIVIALLIEDGNRVSTIVQYYEIFTTVFVFAIPFVFLIQRYLGNYIPNVPWSNIPVIWISPGELNVHLTGAVVFALVGFRKTGAAWLVCLIVALTMASASSRGAVLAFVVPVAFAVFMLGKLRELAMTVVAGLAIFAAAYGLEAAVTTYQEASYSEERSLSAHQIADNVASIVGNSNEQAAGTETWRLDWWNIIMRDTLFGPHFWDGRGFGLNLAVADGFEDGSHPDLPTLRSPHNVNMTILARGGVPGLTLWLMFIGSWMYFVLQAMLRARQEMRREWAALFLFTACYAASFIINASFDVALEGPVQGIWFWSVIGFGIGAVFVFRLQPTDDPLLSEAG